MADNGDWAEVLLEDVSAELTVGHVGPMVSEYVDSGIPFLRSKNVDPFGIDWNDIRYIRRDFHERLKKSALSPGDVVIVRTGKPGAAALIPDSLLESNCSDLVIVRTGPKLDARFLVYYINSVAKHHVDSHLVGAVQQHFNVGSARKLRMHLPPLSEQKAIAHILGSLDDKIELNRRMNETLEATARALFKSWFVDFDPVRAKIDGQKPLGMDEQTAKLFPDGFEHVNGELIPADWRFTSLEELAEILNGHAFKSRDYEESGVFVLRTKNFEAHGRAARRDDDVFLPESFLESHRQYICEPFDFHLVMVGASVGKTSLLLPHLLPALRNQNMWCFRPKSCMPSRAFLNLSVERKVDEVMSWASGSARAFFRKSDFKKHTVMVPSNSLLRAFQRNVEPLYGRISSNSAESEELAAIRDTLLPKLLSGELRVGEAEKLAEETV